LSQKYTIVRPEGTHNKKENKVDSANRHENKDTLHLHRKNNETQAENGEKRATVWIKKDSILTARRIITGLNNETEVQVISGLDTTDEIVAGYQLLTKTEAKKKTADKSPFLPSRPGGNNNRKRSGNAATPPR